MSLAQPLNVSQEQDGEQRSRLLTVHGNIVVTRGVSASGLSTARALLENGAPGCCLWDSESALRESQPALIKLARSFPRARCFAIAVDVAEEIEVEEAINSVTQHLGSIDHFFCFEDMESTTDSFIKTVQVSPNLIEVRPNLAFACAEWMARHMMKRNKGQNQSITLVATMTRLHSDESAQTREAYIDVNKSFLERKARLADGCKGHAVQIGSVILEKAFPVEFIANGDTQLHGDMMSNQDPSDDLPSVKTLEDACVYLAAEAGRSPRQVDLVIDASLT